MGPFTFETNETNVINVAFIFAPSTATSIPLNSMSLLKTFADSIRSYYLADSGTCGLFSNNVPIEAEKNKFIMDVYPNPTNGKLTVKINEPFINASVKIINLTGQTVNIQNNFSGNRFSIDVSNFANGIYFLEINDGEIFSRTKFIKN